MKIIELKNGIKVINLSSPHPFTFDCGTVVPAVDDKTATSLMLKSKEVESQNPGGWTDIQLSFEMSKPVEFALIEGQRSEADILLCSFPIIQALRNRPDLKINKARTVRVVDRVKKICSSSKFCI